MPRRKGQMDRVQETAVLPVIPDKRYFSIGEVSELCDLKDYVLRYWEQEFPLLSPSKRRGNRRYYQKKDILLIEKIKSLLYLQGYTIAGARTLLESERLHPQETTIKPSIINKMIAGLEEALTHLA